MKWILEFLIIASIAGCTSKEGPMGPQGEQGTPGPTGPQGPQGTAYSSVEFIEFTLTLSSYDNGVIALQSPRVRIDNFLGLSFLTEINGETLVLPLTYPVAGMAPEVSIANRIQVLVGDGLVIILDNNSGLLGYIDGFLGSSGATSMTLAVAILAN